MSWALLVAWLLPLAAGSACWMALNPVRGPGWSASAFGIGGVLGLLLTAAVTALAARGDTEHAWIVAAPWLAGVAVLALVVAIRRCRLRQPSHGASAANRWLRLLLVVALATLVARGWLMLREILLRPTFPWDAWDAWEVKSKTWFLLGHYVPFVSMAQWLAHPQAPVYTSVAWAYPSTLAWMQVWFASAVGDWNEPMVNLPWFALWTGLLLGHYGQWRALGLDRIRALVAVYALGSLPLLDVHVALAGYADLWLACLLGFAVSAWLRWRRDHDVGQLIVAVVCALLLPAIKLEGAVWLLLGATIAFCGALPRRWRRWCLGIAVALLALLLVVGRVVVPVPGLGWVTITHSHIVVPRLGEYTLHLHGGALVSVLSGLFVQPNWHLLWWIAPGIVLWRWRALRADPALRNLGTFIVLGLGFLLFLFAGTDAARWAASYTAVNRLVLHIVPATITLLAMLCRRQVSADTGPSAEARRVPA